jgi:NAD(P)-dependent dehydrogenase (short-subunit alcohol dehydrogenase family)
MSFKHGGKGGAIVNVSSAAARLGAGEYVDYAASKGAVDTLTGLSLEVAAQGIRVTACVRALSIPIFMRLAVNRVESIGEIVTADAARRPAGRGGPGDCLAAEREGVVRDGSFIELAGGK